MAIDQVAANQATIQQIIDSTQAKANAGRKAGGSLGKDEFLNLLIAQLRYQDPLSPMDDKDFIGQMAQFSSLEQMKNIYNSVSQANSYALIGKYVKASYTDEASNETKSAEGFVDAVRIKGGTAYAVVNGREITIDKITEVTEGMMMLPE